MLHLKYEKITVINNMQSLHYIDAVAIRTGPVHRRVFAMTYGIKSLFEIYMKFLRLRANGCNKSQHCCANNAGSCCVRVGSGVQTDSTTPNNVGTCSASWEGYNQ